MSHLLYALNSPDEPQTRGKWTANLDSRNFKLRHYPLFSVLARPQTSMIFLPAIWRPSKSRHEPKRLNAEKISAFR
jgi:hypothetical protein